MGSVPRNSGSYQKAFIRQKFSWTITVRLGFRILLIPLFRTNWLMSMAVELISVGTYPAFFEGWAVGQIKTGVFWPGLFAPT